MLTALFSLLTMAAASPQLPIHDLVWCTALLTTSEFDEVGRRIAYDEPLPEGLSAGRPFLPSSIESDRTTRLMEEFEKLGFDGAVVEYAREFVGPEAIEAYSEAVRARARTLQQKIDADRNVPSWTAFDKKMFALSSVLPGLMTIALVTEAWALVREPAAAWWAIPANAVAFSFAYLVLRADFDRFRAYVRALSSAEPKPILHRRHPDYESPVAMFLVYATHVPAEHVTGPKLWTQSSRVHADRVLEPLRSNDDPVVRENSEVMYHEALVEALTEPEYMFGTRVLEIDFRAFVHPETRKKHLRVFARILKPANGFRGHHPKDLPRIDQIEAIERAAEGRGPGGVLAPQGI